MCSMSCISPILLYLILLLFQILRINESTQDLRQLQNLTLNLITNMNKNDTRFEMLDKWLTLPTSDIPQLKLMLRKQFFQQDAENIYTRWFIERSTCMLTIASYDVSEEKQIIHGTAMKINRLNYVIVSSMERLKANSERFLQRAGSFFFIINDEIVMEQLREILQMHWVQYSVFKNFILTADDGVLYFDPFEFDTERMRYGIMRTYSGQQHLERSLFSDMRGYPLRVQIFKSVYARPLFDKKSGKISYVEGVDGEVARLLETRMNFSMILQEPDPDYFGERNANGTYNGAISSIINNEIDLCLTGFFVKDYMVPELDFTVAVYDDKLCIYVPKASRIPQSILPIFAVGYNLWLSFIFAAFACATVWCVIRRINLNMGNHVQEMAQTFNVLKKNYWWQFVRIYIDTWVVWVRVNVIHYPPFHSERIFLVSLCLVSVIFGAIFESSLATVYIHPLYYNDINTLRELDESGLKIIYKYSSMADDLFFSDTSVLFANLNKKLTHLKNLNADVIYDVAYHGGKAGVTRYTSLLLESLHFIVSKRVWIVPECPKYYTISYVMPKDSPWEEGINNLLLQFLNAGLITKWINDMEAKVDRQIMKEHLFESIDNFKVLTIADLQLAFYVVFMGSFLAVLAFFGEYFIRKYMKPHFKRQSTNYSK